VITSPRNPGVAAARALRARSRREEVRRFLVEGPGPVAEAIRAGAVHDVFVTGRGEALPEPPAAAASALRVHEVSAAVMKRLAATVAPQGPVAVCGFVDAPLASLAIEAGPLVVLIEVRDPGNLGTIVRTADASGAAGVVVSAKSVDVYNEKAVRASAGSIFHLPIVREAEPAVVLSALRERGVSVLAAAADGQHDLYDDRVASLFGGPVALVLGNEARGLDPVIRAQADMTVCIPMRGRAESLNLAAAAAVILFEVSRQRPSRTR
jgi:RNA methyltransferase, TrmH family